ncbi:MAG: hypothetical protein IPJ58_00260 [Ardenticatenia bacterium]|nr:hypothetical protein [Ardenticatenia bacterium]
MNWYTVAQAWEMALRQFVDTDSPFGRARLVCSACLLLLAVLVSLAGAHDRRRRFSLTEAWIGSGLAIIIGLNTIDALTATLSQLLLVAVGRELGGTGSIDLALGSLILMICLALWGLAGMGVMGLARTLGRRIGERLGPAGDEPAA